MSRGARRRAHPHDANWRFLLPASLERPFEHLALFGGAHGLDQCLREHGVAHRVSVGMVQERSADAVIVLHNATVGLDRAVECLAPGGVFYYEVDRRRLTTLAWTPRRSLRALRAMHLAPTGLYLVAPGFENCKRYIPLDVSEALRWYFDALYFPGSFRGYLVEHVIRQITRLQGNRFAVIAPCYSITAVAEGRPRKSTWVLNNPELPPELHQPELRPIVLTSGQDAGSRVIVLPIAPGDTQPRAVLKIVPNPSMGSNTTCEQATLTQLQARLSSALKRTVPRPLGIVRTGELVTALETCAPGHSLWVSSGRWRFSTAHQIGDLHIATRWLVAFHQEIQLGRRQWSTIEIQRWLETPFAAYRDRFGLVPREHDLFNECKARAAALIGTPFPIVWQHHDYGPWNLFRTETEFTVIDWEMGESSAGIAAREGPILCDLIYFVTYWNSVVRRLHDEAAELRGFQELFIEKHPKDRLMLAAHQAIDEYLSRLGVDKRVLPILLVYTWVVRALRHAERKQVLEELGPNPRIRNRFVDYVNVLSQHTQQLFAAS